MADIMGLHDAFMSAESKLKVTPEGNGRYDMHPNSLKPRTAAQQLSVRKAAIASSSKRMGMPKIGKQVGIGKGLPVVGKQVGLGLLKK